MINLENLKSGEHVMLIIKRHWIVYVMIGVFFLLGVGISTILFVVFSLTFISIMSNIVFWMFFSIFLYIEWLNHELDMYVVTNNRFIGIEQIAFLNRAVSECNLGQVQEVNSKMAGLFANIFNYGTVSIQTAGNVTTLKMDFAPDSIQAARKILNIVDDYRNNQNNQINKSKNNENN